MKVFFQETWYIIRDFFYFIVNYFFLLWAHSPLFSLTSDSNFTNLQFSNKDKDKNKDVRLSLISIYFGEFVFHFISYNFTKKEFRLIKKLSLSSLEIFNIDSNNPKFKQIMDKFQQHVSNLSKEDKNIEKEALIREIENENARINKSDTKINIYSAIILAIISIINFKSFNNFSFKISFKYILCVLSIYFFINICAIIVQNIKVKSFNSNSFSDLKSSSKKGDFYLEQLYSDYFFTKEKANLFVSYILRIYDYINILIILMIFIFSTNFINKKLVEKSSYSQESTVITINMENLSNVYSEDSVAFSEFLLQIQKNHYSRILLLSQKDISETIKEHITIFDRQKKYYLIDNALSENEVKIIMEK